jgi:hypothetical protein
VPDGEAGLITPFVYKPVSPLALDENGNYRVGTVPETIPGSFLPAILLGLYLIDRTFHKRTAFRFLQIATYKKGI